MKTYQDTETGKLWAFEDNIDPKELKNKRIPETLTIDILEQPSKEYIWYKGDWILKKDAPQDYKELSSSVPTFNPAWISFLFPLGTFLLPDSENSLDISLEEINNNSYNGEKFQAISTTIKLPSSICKLPILLSYDGCLAIPMDKNISTVDQAVNLINKIKGAIFLGGILVEATDYKEIECGNLSDDGQSINSYMISGYNRLRSNQSSLSELSIVIKPNYIKTSQFQDALNLGLHVSNNINKLSIEFIMRGYKALIAWNTGDALNNLWIAVEQLTSFLYERDILEKINTLSSELKQEINKRKKNDGDMSIYNKHELLKMLGSLKEDCVKTLSIARKKRNDLAHEGITPEIEIVENLWFSLFSLLEASLTDTVLDKLLNNTSYIKSNKRYFKKHYPPKFSDKRQVDNLDFTEWKKYED